MKHFLKVKRKKSPEPPQQSGSSGRPADVAAAPQAELDVTFDGRHSLPRHHLGADQSDLAIPLADGGRIGPRIMFQDGMGVDQEPPASGAWTPSFAILDTGHGNQPTSESSLSLRIYPTFTQMSVFLPTGRGRR